MFGISFHVFHALHYKFLNFIIVVAVVEYNLDNLPYKNFEWIQGHAQDIDIANRIVRVRTTDGESCINVEVPYDFLCIATGARPRRLLDSPYVYVVRDIDSVQKLAERLKSARSVVIVGNGGIALDLADTLRGLDVTWLVRHGCIGDAFFDTDASRFLLDELRLRRMLESNRGCSPIKVETCKGAVDSPAARGGGCDNSDETAALNVEGARSDNSGDGVPLSYGSSYAAPRTTLEPAGHAVGPTWSSTLPFKKPLREGCFRLELEAEVIAIHPSKRKAGCESSYTPSTHSYDLEESHGLKEGKYTKLVEPYEQLEITLSHGELILADVIISAIGVDPAVEWVPKGITKGDDGGIVVNKDMRTNVSNIFAAGDACTANFDSSFAPHWFQMRLWTQARTMGVWAAHSMLGIGDQTGIDVGFEVFTHATRFLGKKIVLLGLYNGQGLEHVPEEDLVSYSREIGSFKAENLIDSTTKRSVDSCRIQEIIDHRTFVRVLLLRGRVQGAVLIGETDLEETMENLIYDAIDVSSLGASILDPDVELDHIFD